MKKIGISAAVVLLASVGTTTAEPAYSSKQIVEHFIKSAKLGESRAICIGTDQECTAKKNAPLEAIDMRVNFELNSATLTASARDTLKEFAVALNDPKLEIASFEVDGHTDARGGEVYNDRLSLERAKVVADELVALGVDSSRIKTHGFGMSKPMVADGFADVNRRVEARMVLPSE